MWYLQEWPVPQKANEPPYPILYWFGGTRGCGRTIGRKNVDIRLKATSVSRTHAKIRVQHSSFHKSTGRTVPTVEDSSAYGTFLKYPPGHSANRSSRRDGHHDRLDKETQVQIAEGALLAFGAPSPWWRVGWVNIAVYPHSLSDWQEKRLKDLVPRVGLTVDLEARPESMEHITHLVTPLAKSSSATTLRAIIAGKWIVHPNWTDAVGKVVLDGCRLASSSSTDKEACAHTKLPKEEQNFPPWSEEDKEAFGSFALNQALTRRDVNREKMFAGLTFMFASDNRFHRLTGVVKLCGAQVDFWHPDAGQDGTERGTQGSQAHGSIVVYVEPLQGQAPKPSISEREILTAIFLGEANKVEAVATAVQKGVGEAKTPPAGDVATPAPSDSDAETTEHDPVETAPPRNVLPKSGLRRPRSAPRSSPEDSVQGGNEEIADESNRGRQERVPDSRGDYGRLGRRGRAPEGHVESSSEGEKRVVDDGQVKPGQADECGRGGSVGESTGVKEVDGQGEQDGRENAGNGVEDDVNPVKFFEIEERGKGSLTEVPERATGTVGVKRFRKQLLPDAGSSIPLEKVRESELEELPMSVTRDADSNDGDVETRAQRQRGAFVEDNNDDEVERAASPPVSKRRRRR